MVFSTTVRCMVYVQWLNLVTQQAQAEGVRKNGWEAARGRNEWTLRAPRESGKSMKGSVTREGQSVQGGLRVAAEPKATPDHNKKGLASCTRGPAGCWPSRANPYLGNRFFFVGDRNARQCELVHSKRVWQSVQGGLPAADEPEATLRHTKKHGFGVLYEGASAA